MHATCIGLSNSSLPEVLSRNTYVCYFRSGENDCVDATHFNNTRHLMSREEMKHKKPVRLTHDFISFIHPVDFQWHDVHRERASESPSSS